MRIVLARRSFLARNPTGEELHRFPGGTAVVFLGMFFLARREGKPLPDWCFFLSSDGRLWTRAGDLRELEDEIA